MCVNGRDGSGTRASAGFTTSHDRPQARLFPPEVAVHAVKMACERPDERGRSLCQGDGAERARPLVAEGLVDGISDETVRRILAHHKLTPWRHHLWLSPNVPRDARFAAHVRAIIDLYTRPLAPGEAVICVDETTTLQPRPRVSPTRPARRGRPVRVEHEYRRCGALTLCAGFDTRSGHVYARTARRKRPVEVSAFLEHLDREVPATVTTLHLVMDNRPMHNGRTVQAWLAAHPRFRFHFPPVHCAWMNQVEQWFSILQRKRLRIVDVANLDHLAARLYAFVAEWNAHAHPFNWSSKSVAKVMAACEEALPDVAFAA